MRNWERKKFLLSTPTKCICFQSRSPLTRWAWCSMHIDKTHLFFSIHFLPDVCKYLWFILRASKILNNRVESVWLSLYATQKSFIFIAFSSSKIFYCDTILKNLKRRREIQFRRMRCSFLFFLKHGMWFTQILCYRCRLKGHLHYLLTHCRQSIALIFVVLFAFFSDSEHIIFFVLLLL